MQKIQKKNSTHLNFWRMHHMKDVLCIGMKWLSPSPVIVPGPMMMDESLDNSTTLIIWLLLLGADQHNIFGSNNICNLINNFGYLICWVEVGATLSYLSWILDPCLSSLMLVWMKDEVRVIMIRYVWRKSSCCYQGKVTTKLGTST